MKHIRRIQGDDSIHLVSVNGDELRTLRSIGNGGGGGTKDYNALQNLPSIGGVTVEGSKTLTDYGLPTIPSKTSQLTNDSGFVNATGAANAAPVQSVNGATGNVTVSVPTAISQLTNDSGYVNVAGAAAAAPVQSVNGQTGNVSLTIPTVPTDVSAFNNDAGYVNATQAANAAPVQSVNGQTGAVTLTIPTVPTNVSSFNNDAGYLTLSTLPVYNGGVG